VSGGYIINLMCKIFRDLHWIIMCLLWSHRDQWTITLFFVIHIFKESECKFLNGNLGQIFKNGNNGFSLQYNAERNNKIKHKETRGEVKIAGWNKSHDQVLALWRKKKQNKTKQTFQACDNHEVWMCANSCNNPVFDWLLLCSTNSLNSLNVNYCHTHF